MLLRASWRTLYGAPALRTAAFANNGLRQPPTFGLALRRGMARDDRPPGSRFARPTQGNQQSDEQLTSSPNNISPSAQPAHRSNSRQPHQFSQSQTSTAAHRTPAPSEAQPTNTPSPSETPTRVEPTSTTASSAPSTSEQTKPSSEEPQQVPISSLPDLTQGIPSTLEYETTNTRSRSALSTIEGDGDAAAGAGGRGRGELPASAYITSTERRRQRIANYLFGSILLFAVGGTIYMGRDWNEEDRNRHPEQPNGWGLGLWWNRARTRMRELMTYYHEPAFEKLLPDPDPMFSRPYTLCISLEDMLVHSEWSREHGWRVAKRPGVDYFIRYLSHYYELVLFTTVPFAIGEPLVRKLDPFRLIVWPLYREATKYKDGEVVKDLSYLNRDLSKVIILDTNAQHVRAQPENAIILPKWTGDPDDKGLVDLIPFLEYVNVMEYDDVRKVLKSFDGTDIPKEFARREALARAEFNKKRAGEKGATGASGGRATGGLAGLGGLFGLNPSKMSLMLPVDGEQSPQEAMAQGKMLQDIARERGQKAYQLLEKEIRENGEKWLKEDAEAQKKAQDEAMSNMKTSFTGWFVGGGGQNPPTQPSAAQPKA